MAFIPTCKIVCGWHEDGWVSINTRDFDPEVHVEWVPPAEVAAEESEDAAADGADGAAKPGRKARAA